jgi:hypothetical protein
MAILGDILGAARNASAGFQDWLERSDPEVAGAVKQAAVAHGITPTGYVRMAIADFNRFASEEDWATLTSSLKNTDDPGTTCLVAMAHWRLNVPGCSEHSPGSTAMAGDQI